MFVVKTQLVKHQAFSFHNINKKFITPTCMYISANVIPCWKHRDIETLEEIKCAKEIKPIFMPSLLET